MSLYETSEWPTDSEKKLNSSTAFEEESVFADFGELDPKLEYSVDIQQLIAGTTSEETGVNQLLFPDLLTDTSDSTSLVTLSAFGVTSDVEHGSCNGDVTLGDTALLTAAGVTRPPNPDPDIAHQLHQQAHHYTTSIAVVRTPMPPVALEVSSNVVGFTAADCPSLPEVQSDGVSGSGQQVIVDDVDFTTDTIQSVDLSAALNAGATLLELPTLVLASSTPSPPPPSPGYQQEEEEEEEAEDFLTSSCGPSTSRSRGGRKSLKATPPGKKRYIEKNSDEYKERRERNNVAVRKSRDKAKLKQAETNSRVKVLSDKNDALQKKVDLLTKELNVLKGLFTNIGASLPEELKHFFIKQEQ